MYQDIRTALILHYEALALGVPVVQENSDESDSTHIKIFFIPNANDTVTLGDQGVDRHTGLLQFNVVVEAGTKSFQAFEYASLIVKHYPRGKTVTSNGYTAKITGATSAGGFTSENKYTVPVTINWSADIQRAGL